MSDAVASYYENLKNPKHLEELKELWQFLTEQLPEAEVDMSYGMPSLRQDENIVVTIASQKKHMSLYMDMDLVETHRDELGNLNCGKSCIRFTKLEKLPLEVIATIIQETLEKQAQ